MILKYNKYLSTLLYIYIFTQVFSGYSQGFVVFNENFNNVGTSISANQWKSTNGAIWTWTANNNPQPTLTEEWIGSGGATARSISSTYIDTNGMTQYIQGGIEIFSSGGPNTQTYTVSTTELVNNTVEGLVYSFYASRRVSTYNPYVSLFDVTTSTYLLNNYTLTGLNSTWKRYSFDINTAIDSGDILKLSFSDTGNSSAAGLEISMVNLYGVQTIPEPSTFISIIFGFIIFFVVKKLLD